MPSAPELPELNDPSVSLFAEVTIAPEERQHLQDLALDLSNAIYRDSFDSRGKFLSETKPLAEAMRGTGLALPSAALKDGSLVATTITGLPTDPELPPAPIDGGMPVGKKTFISEGLAIAMASLIGYPSIILGEKKEALVHQITPVPGMETSQSNAGQVDLLLHQDLAPNPELPRMPYDAAMPDWLILSGVQAGSGNTQTFIASVDVAAGQLSPETRAVLSEDRFITNPPDSFLKAMPGAANNLPTHPVLMERDGHIEASFDTSSDVRPIGGPADHEAVSAMAELNAALTRVKKEVVIVPGTAVIFNNRRVVHGRGAVSDEHNFGLRRWIQRVYIYDPTRITGLTIGYPGRVLQIGGGLVRLASASSYSERLLEMASQ